MQDAVSVVDRKLTETFSSAVPTVDATTQSTHLLQKGHHSSSSSSEEGTPTSVNVAAPSAHRQSSFCEMLTPTSPAVSFNTIPVPHLRPQFAGSEVLTLTPTLTLTPVTLVDAPAGPPSQTQFTRLEVSTPLPELLDAIPDSHLQSLFAGYEILTPTPIPTLTPTPADASADPPSQSRFPRSEAETPPAPLDAVPIPYFQSLFAGSEVPTPTPTPTPLPAPPDAVPALRHRSQSTGFEIPTSVPTLSALGQRYNFTFQAPITPTPAGAIQTLRQPQVTGSESQLNEYEVQASTSTPEPSVARPALHHQFQRAETATAPAPTNAIKSLRQSQPARSEMSTSASSPTLISPHISFHRLQKEMRGKPKEKGETERERERQGKRDEGKGKENRRERE